MATKPAAGRGRPAGRGGRAPGDAVLARRRPGSWPGRPSRGTGAARDLVLPPGPDRDRLAEALRAEGYDGAICGSRRGRSRSRVAGGERPDLLVIGTAAGEGDPSAVASVLDRRRSTRPRAVVLVETLRAVDRLRAIAAGVDAVFAVERMAEDLPRYARTLARTGAPPSTVLLVEHDAERGRPLAARAGGGQHPRRPLRAGQAVQELLEREVPDLLLLATQLADAGRRYRRPDGAPGPAVPADADRLRPAGDVRERVAALQAGADDFLPDAAPTRSCCSRR